MITKATIWIPQNHLENRVGKGVGSQYGMNIVFSSLLSLKANGDGTSDLITGAGVGHTPEVKVYDGQKGKKGTHLILSEKGTSWIIVVESKGGSAARRQPELGVVARRVPKDGQTLWQWSDPALPHGAGRRR